jgi:hypothetical protein
VVINGLPILNIEPDLDVHYREQVIGGAGSFMIVIQNYDQFAEAIVRKLVTEIAALPDRLAPERHAGAAASATDCDNCGEKRSGAASYPVMYLAGRSETAYSPPAIGSGTTSLRPDSNDVITCRAPPPQASH